MQDFRDNQPEKRGVQYALAMHLVGSTTPTLEGKLIQVASGVVRRQADVYHYDADIGITSMLVVNSPFIFRETSEKM